jgi:hypothetical protein
VPLIKKNALDWYASCHGIDDFGVRATLGSLRVKPDGSFAKTERTTEKQRFALW